MTEQTDLWPQVRLARVLSPIDRSMPSSELAEINIAGVFSFGRGLFKRGPLLPSETSYKSYNRLHTDDFVISQPKAWEGALGRVPAELEGWYLSPVFPTFRCDASALDPRYLEWFCRRRAVWIELQSKAKGLGARRETVSVDQFLTVEIPLPPLPEQQSIVARIDEVAKQLDHAQFLQATVATEAEELCRALLRDTETVATPLREVVSLRAPDVRVQADLSYHFAGVYSFGRGVFVGNTKSGTEFAYPRLTRLRAGDFVYPKLMAWEGAFGIVPPECDGLVVSTEFPVFEVNRDRVLPAVLDVHFRNPALWTSIGGASTGTNVRRRRLNPQDFLDLELPLPSMERQRLLAKAYEDVHAVKARQSESRAMLQALLPAILDRAFAGAL